MDEEKIIEERKKKLSGLLKKPMFWTIVFLIFALILGAYIRTMPMQDHSTGTPPSLIKFITFEAFKKDSQGLRDVSTNDWTLGPDLDPWLFTRYAKETIEMGSLPKWDNMRNVPLGYDPTLELQMVSNMIILTYKLANMFGISSINFAAAFMPVLIFLLTIIAFFLLVREIFISEDEKAKIRANLIALISTFFMIVIPSFLSRTVAGIPEKESVGFFFMFAAFYLMLKAWKSKKTIYHIVLGVLAGISTALMGLTWGGVVYIYVTIAVASFVAFLLNKVGKKESITYALWIITSLITTFLFTSRYSLKGFVTSLDSGLATIVLFIIIINYILWHTKIKDMLTKIKFFRETKIPKNLLTIIIAIVILLILAFVILGPNFIFQKISGLNRTLFNPIMGRWSTTVAENRQPYFQEWASEFGPYIKNLPNVPIMFWLFFIGSAVLIKSLLNKLNKKDSWILTGLYILFFFGLVFSRYAAHPALFDGEDFLSKGFYLGSALIFIIGLIYYYIKYEKEGNKGFEEIGYGYLLLFALFILCLFTARSAVRLIMVLAPIAPIFVGFLIVDSIDRFRNAKDETWKIIIGALMILILIAGAFSFYNYYQSVKYQAYGFVPSYYNQQWQLSMSWVRNETPKDAVFAHWWDYGYWVQSIGERATVLDGGNVLPLWNYYMGRFVLTGDNQADSLEFLYNHNATHLLIDSSDIGKYGAFSSIGSDLKYDRYSWIGTFLMDETQTQETKNQTLLVYTGGVALDDDVIVNDSGDDIYLPGQKTGVGAIIIPTTKNNDSTGFGQPYAIMIYNGVQQKVNLRYLFIEGDASTNGKFIDFKSGIEGCAYVFPKVTPDGQGRVSENKIGAIMFLTPRLMRGYLAQKYILEDPFNKFPNFKIAHIEPSIIGSMLNNQGMKLPDFFYFNGVQGPITIWKINYTGKEKVNQAYLDIDSSKYLSWEL